MVLGDKWYGDTGTMYKVLDGNGSVYTEASTALKATRTGTRGMGDAESNGDGEDHPSQC